jgi:hypothetical protein
MDTFGIRASELGDSDEHYVGEDAALFDWLLADNYEPSDRGDSLYIVKAPEGYVFYKDSLYSTDSPEVKEGDGKNLSDFSYVTSGSSQNDKALMLLEGALKFMEPAEFEALDIDEERILDFLIY